MSGSERVDILVVDDDFDMRDTLIDVLNDEGYRVAVAADGLEAMAYLEANPAPRVILLDWMMPRCDARQFRERQRLDSRLRAIPVVLLTANARLEVNDLFEGLLLKPVDLGALLATVASYCRPARDEAP